jgi:hypothetical protein
MKFLLGLSLSLCLLAQSTPTRETLLRQRVDEFWKAFLDGKYRRADSLVLEDDKDAFFSWPKKKIFKIETSQVKFTEDGKMAEVMTPVETDEMMVGVGQLRITRPVLTYWKLAEDNWWWFAPKDVVREGGPFGKMLINPSGQPENAQTPIPRAAPVGPTVAELWTKVMPNKTELAFALDRPGTATVEFRNDMPGRVGLLLDIPPREEFMASYEPKDIPGGGVGVLTIQYKPIASALPLKPGVYEFRATVAQTGKTHTIRVTMLDKPAASKPR